MNKILIIDDDPNIRELLRDVLEGAGHTVIEAKNGNAGIESAQQDQPDLVIVDILMPEKEGLETISEIKKNLKNARILAISGGGRKADMNFLHLAEKLGADRTLAKPFRIENLTQTVNGLLQS